MAYDESDYEDDLRDQALDLMFQEWLPDAVWHKSVGVAARYLRTYGDAIEGRVTDVLNDAKKLATNGHNEAALTRAFTAIEVTISYLLFRPLFLGALLSDELARQFVGCMFKNKNGQERKFLPTVLRYYGIELEQVALPNGKPLWAAITGPIYDCRCKVVHGGASATVSECAETIAAAELLFEQVVRPLAKQLGFTLEATGKWAEIGVPPYTRKFQTEPFPS